MVSYMSSFIAVRLNTDHAAQGRYSSCEILVLPFTVLD